MNKLVFSLTRWKLKGDLIEVDNYDWYSLLDSLFSPRVEISDTRGHRFKVKGGKITGVFQGKCLTQRVAVVWNVVSGRVVEVSKKVIMYEASGGAHELWNRGRETICRQMR